MRLFLLTVEQFNSWLQLRFSQEAPGTNTRENARRVALRMVRGIVPDKNWTKNIRRKHYDYGFWKVCDRI